MNRVWGGDVDPDGDGGAVPASFRRLHQHIYVYCRRRTDVETARECASETFLIAWRRIDDVPPDGQALRWLYGVARRVLANRFRSQRRSRRLISRLGGLRSDPVHDDEFREEVADAEIIFVFGNPAGSGPDEGCAPWTKPHWQPPERATPADWAPYGDVLRDILDVVFELRAGQPTVIRVADEWAAPIADWREAGVEAVCTAGWEAHAGVIREAADEYGAGTASWYDAFNGPDHDEDPREKGYISSDGWHQSLEGAAAQVEVLHTLGYDPIVP